MQGQLTIFISLLSMNLVLFIAKSADPDMMGHSAVQLKRVYNVYQCIHSKVSKGALWLSGRVLDME